MNEMKKICDHEMFAEVWESENQIFWLLSIDFHTETSQVVDSTPHNFRQCHRNFDMTSHLRLDFKMERFPSSSDAELLNNFLTYNFLIPFPYKFQPFFSFGSISFLIVAHNET